MSSWFCDGACRLVGLTCRGFPFCRSVLLYRPGDGNAPSWVGSYSANVTGDSFDVPLRDVLSLLTMQVLSVTGTVGPVCLVGRVIPDAYGRFRPAAAFDAARGELVRQFPQLPTEGPGFEVSAAEREGWCAALEAVFGEQVRVTPARLLVVAGGRHSARGLL